MAALEASLAAVKGGDGDGGEPASAGREAAAKRSSKARGRKQAASKSERYAASRSSSNQTRVCVRRARRPSGPTARARGRGPSPTGARGPASARRARSPGPGRRPRSAGRGRPSTTTSVIGPRRQPGMADRVRHELGDEQPRVLEPARREMVGDVGERAPCLRRASRDRAARSTSNLIAAAPAPGGSSTKSSRSSMRVISNTRITCSCRGTSANRRPSLSRTLRRRSRSPAGRWSP